MLDYKYPLNKLSIGSIWAMLALLLVFMTVPFLAQAQEPANAEDSVQILEAFNRQHQEAERAKAISEKDKQRIMFIIGVMLIILVMITGGLGIALGIYGKPVFLAHMIFAGLSMTLAVVHAIVGFVWFYPF